MRLSLGHSFFKLEVQVLLQPKQLPRRIKSLLQQQPPPQPQPQPQARQLCFQDLQEVLGAELFNQPRRIATTRRFWTTLQARVMTSD